MEASDSYPANLGEYVRLDWTITALCYDCTGTDKFPINIRAALDKYGPDYPTRDFMLGQICKCGRKAVPLLLLAGRAGAGGYTTPLNPGPSAPEPPPPPATSLFASFFRICSPVARSRRHHHLRMLRQ